MNEIRGRFAHIDSDPFTGPRIFFENAGGALTLKSVVETSATYAAIPDNQGRENAAADALADVINLRTEIIELVKAAEMGQFDVGQMNEVSDALMDKMNEVTFMYQQHLEKLE